MGRPYGRPNSDLALGRWVPNLELTMALPQPPIPQTATCYRHPEREAGRRCTRCGRPACAECLVQANVGSHCLECAKAAKPDVKTRARYWSARQPTLVTYTLIAVNIAVFAWLGLQDSRSLTGSNTTQGQFDLGLFKPALAQNGEWYRLVTSGFLHFGIIHIAFNMLLLFQLGQLLEPAIGRIRFALLYFGALLAGSAGALLMQPNAFHGGASGAVFGLMGAAFIGLRNRGVNPFSTGLGSVLLINLLFTFTIPGISIGGHIGGIIGGAAAGWVVLAPPYRNLPKWASYAAPAAVIVLSILVSVAVVRS
ncbi:MAG: rhomboid family intramembrane serine protease [Ilumatobacteraceae bacterium]